MLNHSFWRIVFLVILVCACTSETNLSLGIEEGFDEVPEELLGNWMVGENGNWLLSERANELIVSENTISWKGAEYEIIDSHPLVKTHRVVAVDGGNTLALYVSEIKNNRLYAAVEEGFNLPLDETGELLPRTKTEFIRWWYPFGVKYPPAGTKWVYSYYRRNDHGHADDYGRYSFYKGTVSLAVLKSDSDNPSEPIRLRQTIFMDTLHLHSFEANYVEPYNGTYYDSLATGFVYGINDYNLYYLNDTLFIAQDSADLVVSPMRVINNTRIYMQLFSINNESFLTGRDISLSRNKGIVKIEYFDGFGSISWNRYDFRMELLEYQPETL